MRPGAGGDLGRAIAIVLRAGTISAVAGIMAGFGLVLLDGSAGPGATPLVDALRAGGPDAFIGAGLLVLTLTPPAALAVLTAACVMSLPPPASVPAALAPRRGRTVWRRA